MIGVAVPDRVETDLAAGAIACPGCGGALRPWGHARARRVRDLTTTVALRPRRARCSACRGTHVLLPGTVLPRRADTTAVIGTALLASALGGGHRRIAADLARPAITVRRWLRAVRGEHAEWLRAAAIDRLAQLDRDVISTLGPIRRQECPSPVGLGHRPGRRPARPLLERGRRGSPDPARSQMSRSVTETAVSVRTAEGPIQDARHSQSAPYRRRLTRPGPTASLSRTCTTTRLQLGHCNGWGDTGKDQVRRRSTMPPGRAGPR